MKAKKYNIWFWIVPLIFAAVVMAGIRLVSDTPTGYKFWERPLEWNLIEFGFAIIIAYLCQFIISYLLERNNKHTGKLTFKMFLSEYLLVLAAGIILFNPCLVLIHYLINDPLGIDDITIANTIFLSILSCIYKSRALLFIVIMYGFPPLFTSINCLLVFPAKKVSVNTCTFPSVSTYTMTTLSIVKSE